MENSDTFDLQLFLPYLLNQAAEESSLSFQRVYKDRYGMLRTEWRVLFHLGIFGQMTARDIGLRARLHKTKKNQSRGPKAGGPAVYNPPPQRCGSPPRTFRANGGGANSLS